MMTKEELISIIMDNIRCDEVYGGSLEISDADVVADKILEQFSKEIADARSGFERGVLAARDAAKHEGDSVTSGYDPDFWYGIDRAVRAIENLMPSEAGAGDQNAKA